MALISSPSAAQRLFSSLKRASSSAFSFSNSSYSPRISFSSSLRRLRSFILRIASAWFSVRLNFFIISALGSSSSRIIRMISSRLRKAIRYPDNISRRALILSRRKRARRCKTMWRWFKNSRRTSLIDITRGTPSESNTFMFILKRISNSVCLNRCSISRLASTARLLGSKTIRTSWVDSSRTSLSIGSFLSFRSWAIFSINLDFTTW